MCVAHDTLERLLHLPRSHRSRQHVRLCRWAKLGPNGEHAQHLRSGRIRLAAEPRNVRCSPQTGDYRLRDSASYCNCYRLALGIYAQVQHNVCDQHAVKTTRVPFEAMAPEWKPSKLLQRLRTSRM